MMVRAASPLIAIFYLLAILERLLSYELCRSKRSESVKG
jgi:hypothetical protein